MEIYPKYYPHGAVLFFTEHHSDESGKKYHIRTKSGGELLLRLSDVEQSEAKKKEYDIITKYSKLGFNMSMPKELFS